MEDWVQQGSEMKGQEINDFFEESVSLSGNGDLISIGGGIVGLIESMQIVETKKFNNRRDLRNRT